LSYSKNVTLAGTVTLLDLELSGSTSIYAGDSSFASLACTVLAVPFFLVNISSSTICCSASKALIEPEGTRKGRLLVLPGVYESFLGKNNGE
jgi:hypothetical protein